MAAFLAIAADARAASIPTNEATRFSSQYSEWAGGRANAESLVAGLRNGVAITLVTHGPNRGISKPSAEQIQAALIDGEARTARGAAALVKGSAVSRGSDSAPSP
jgi:hypothetical protein